eukprot:1534388-Rhodomonas_salina.2
MVQHLWTPRTKQGRVTERRHKCPKPNLPVSDMYAFPSAYRRKFPVCDILPPHREISECWLHDRSREQDSYR